MKVIKPPDRVWVSAKSVFLAGSIEQGKADDWQSKVIEGLKDTEIDILNPRRDNWDASWKQDINEPAFRQQVIWELTGIHLARLTAAVFLKNTYSPITLLELGLLAPNKSSQTIVYCHNDFWRKGNIDIVCSWYGIKMVPSLDALIHEIKLRLQ